MMTCDTLRFTRLRPDAKAPQRATPGSAGYDLYAAMPADVTIAPGETVRVGTGIALALPGPGVVGLVYARSGLGVMYGVVPANCVGVIDSDYRGEVIVGLYNHGAAPYTLHPGDRMAQLVLAPVYTPQLIECDCLEQTQRGAGGWGSTGM